MQNSNLNSTTFSHQKVLVIGDAMIDSYYHGNIVRMSPEANVPVVDILETENKLGGAANVALNIKSLGANAMLIALAGNDNDAILLENMLQNEKIEHILLKENRPTTVKTRIYNQLSYVLRVDKETTEEIDENVSDTLLQNIESAIKNFKPDICILQDYNKGLLTEYNVPLIIQLLKESNILIAVDPKKKNFFSYKNVDLFKPNTKEVEEALQLNFDKNQKIELTKIFDKLHNLLNFNMLLLTLSDQGIFISNKNKAHSFPAFKRKVVDVSGAGDTVIAMAALLLSLGFGLREIAYFSNLAGGLVIEQKGVSTLNIEDFIKNIEK